MIIGEDVSEREWDALHSVHDYIVRLDGRLSMSIVAQCGHYFSVYVLDHESHAAEVKGIAFCFCPSRGMHRVVSAGSGKNLTIRYVDAVESVGDFLSEIGAKISLEGVTNKLIETWLRDQKRRQVDRRRAA